MNRNRCRAFTLMELLLVLAIIGIASAVIIPRITTSGQNFQGQVRELTAVLKYNRRMAIVSSRLQQAKLFPYQEEANGTPLKKGHWRSKGAELSWSKENSNSTPAQKKNQIISIDFFPQGGATGGELILSQEPFKTKIHIDSFTGKVTIEELDDE